MHVEKPFSIHDGITTGYATLHDISSRHSRIMAGRRQFCIKEDALPRERRRDENGLLNHAWCCLRSERDEGTAWLTLSRPLLRCAASETAENDDAAAALRGAVRHWKIDRSLFSRHFWGGHLQLRMPVKLVCRDNGYNRCRDLEQFP